MRVQSTIGGLEHGLTPLAEACSALHVFEQPTQFGGALWLPYRRRREVLEAAIRAAASPLKAIFAHADVVRRIPPHTHASISFPEVRCPSRALRECMMGPGCFLLRHIMGPPAHAGRGQSAQSCQSHVCSTWPT